MADALPGLGIVAAVLGVVITMGSLGGPPEEIGEKVAAALVGTFLGILLCYGVAGPLSSNMAKTAEEHNCYLHVLRVLLLAFLKGIAPIIAIETGTTRDSGACAPVFRRNGKVLQGPGRRRSGTGQGRHRRELRTVAAKTNPSSSSRRRAATAAIMAARGRWRMRIL